MAYTKTSTPIVYYGGKTSILNHLLAMVPVRVTRNPQPETRMIAQSDFHTIKLPQRFDLTPTGKLVLERPAIHSKPYFDNVEYSLNIQFNLDGQVELHYYGEDDTYITPRRVSETNQTSKFINPRATLPHALPKNH